MDRDRVLFNMSPNFVIALFGVGVLVFSGPAVEAQNVQVVDRAQLTREQVQPPFVPTVSPNGVDDGHAAASPNDADIGAQEILKRTEAYQPFTASLSAPFYYTSNVALTPENERGDFLVAPAAALFYQPRLTRTLYGLLAVRQQFFYYDRLNGFDFGSFDANVGLTYFLPQFHNLILHGRYDFNRLTFSDRVADDFFSNNAIILGAELPFRFGRAQQLSLGGNVNISIAADRETPRRSEYEGYIGYSVHLTRSLSVDTVGRLVFRDYANDRSDISGVIAASANYRLTNWWWMSVISTFATNRSDHSIFDYDVANIGGVVSLSISF